MPYRQPPARSPLPGDALVRALATSARGDNATHALRELLTARYAADDVRLCASGTHALTLALRAAGRARPGAPVLLPAYTCYEVATAAIGADVPVALYDLDAATLEPDWSSVRAAARDGAAALVVAPLYGMIVDWDAARETADALGVPLVEDAAQAHGSSWRGRPVGSAGDLSVLSFGRGKGWTGSGGGALLARGAGVALLGEGAEVAPASGGADRAIAAVAQWLLARPTLYALPASIPALKLGETIYHEPTPPRAMAPFCAAVALATDSAALAEAELRSARAVEYQAALERAAPGALCGRARHSDGRAGALRFPVRVAGGWAAARAKGLDRLGVGPPYPTTLARLPALGTRLRGQAEYPVAEALVRELVTLPTHASVGVRDRGTLVAATVASARPVAPAQQSGVGAGSVAIGGR